MPRGVLPPGAWRALRNAGCHTCYGDVYYGTSTLTVALFLTCAAALVHSIYQVRLRPLANKLENEKMEPQTEVEIDQATIFKKKEKTNYKKRKMIN